ncbi:hypothetical protein MB27_24075 [Actinoplanes utahensis]|uniref:Uncharacterized protein n=2 Tax=Actinoplanes utahensis TaxID=1869 RepID=A0A0A6UIA0_ACTUT|nr:hypothetical protein MB27_24075 [Actinoplanes utahensis]
MPAPTTTEPTTARDAALATGISVVGAVCGTVLTAMLDGSPSQKLTGAIVGAVVATLFSVTGPYLHVRAVIGVAVTGAALLLTYGGAAVADGFTGNVTYPRNVPGPTPSASTNSAEPDEVCEGDLCLSAPRSLRLCAATGCSASMVVTNTGSRLLRIKELEIEGPAARTFRHSGDCANHTVKAGRTCTITVTVTAEPTGEAVLVIHQNLEGPATKVALAPSGKADSRPDLRMSTKGRVTATVSQGSTSDVPCSLS